MSLARVTCRLALLCLGASPALAQRGYDPLAVPRGVASAPTDLTVQDDSRARAIPVRIFLPRDTTPAPVVMFSHGLGGSRTGSAYLGEHWSARGYVVVYIQHPGSDEAVWRGVDQAQRMAAMRAAASLQNALLRLRDVPAVLNQLARWNVTPHSPLLGRLDMTRVGMSGHSFGAVTTQGVSGQRAARSIVEFTDSRIRAAVVMSPSTPRTAPAAQAFGGVRVPWLLMTGTRDVSPIGDADLASRLGVFPALPPGGKYELVLDNAEHSAFTDTPLPGDREPRNLNHHRVILALSTAFWDAFLRGDAAARAWLDGAGPKSVLEPGDRWQHK